MAETSPAEVLRAAATLMWERAQAATVGPWTHMCLGSEGCQVLRATGTPRERGRGRVARFGQKEWKADHADAEYVASMDPDFACAVADWLVQAEARGPGGIDFLAALKTARAYLNDPEGSTP